MFERIRRGNRLTITVAKPVVATVGAPVPPPPTRAKQRVAFVITRDGNRTTYLPLVVS